MASMESAVMRRGPSSRIWLAGAALILVATILLPDSSYPSYDTFRGEDKLVERLGRKERLRYNALRFLMNQYQCKQFLSLETEKQRAVWVEQFWLMIDPTPTTEKNERRIEHNQRAALASTRYRFAEKPDWDGRAEILIRYGEPDYIVETEAHIGLYDSRMPGEVWYYNALGFLVSFTDEFLNGRFTYLLDHYSFDYIEFARREGLNLSAREELESIESRKRGLPETRIVLLPQHIDPFFEDPANVMNPDVINFYIAGEQARSTVVQAENIKVMKFDQNLADQAASNFFRYMNERPFLHTAELVDNRLTTYFDITAFRRGPGKIRTEVSFEIPSHELGHEKRGDGYVTDVELRVMVRDACLREVASGSNTIESALDRIPDPGGTLLLPGQVVLTLSPGYYRTGIEANDRCSGRLGAFRTNLNLPCLDTRLTISDIQFARSIVETDENVPFLKGNLQVIPHPRRTYRIPLPITFYFEVYGLNADDEGISFYTVEYEIIPTEKRRWGPVLKEIETVVSSEFRTSGHGTTQVQRLEIATDNLWEGRFELNVSVTDRRTFDVVQKSARFSVLEPGE